METKAPENPHMGSSVFNMDHVNAITVMDITSAKKYALDLIKSSTANAKNKANMSSHVIRSKDVTSLALTMTNHILAHPSENLKVTR